MLFKFSEIPLNFQDTSRFPCVFHVHGRQVCHHLRVRTSSVLNLWLLLKPDVSHRPDAGSLAAPQPHFPCEHCAGHATPAQRCRRGAPRRPSSRDLSRECHPQPRPLSSGEGLGCPSKSFPRTREKCSLWALRAFRSFLAPKSCSPLRKQARIQAAPLRSRHAGWHEPPDVPASYSVLSVASFQRELVARGKPGLALLNRVALTDTEA